MAKEKETEKPDNSAFLCGDCKAEFKGGKSCPECGNTEGNLKLAADGIEQRAHKSKILFNSARELRPVDELINLDNSFSETSAALQKAEMDNNLRDIYVKKSEIKKMELELQHLEKKSQLDAAKERASAGPGAVINSHGGVQQPQSQQPGMDMNAYGSMPFMGMSPQTAFLTGLMKMDKEKRAEFLEQISEADPGALAAMSSMLSPVQSGGMNPGMMNMPPWMQMQQMMQWQQTQSRPEKQTDPTETAMGIVTAMMTLMEKLKPQSDHSVVDAIKELKEEIKGSRRSESPSQSHDINPVIEEVRSLQRQVASLGEKKSITETVGEIREVVEGLVAVGLVEKPGAANKTVDDELKIKKVDFEISRDSRKLEMEEARLKAEADKTNMAKTVMQGLLQRSFLRNRKPDDGGESPIKKVVFSQPKPSAAPAKEVVEEHVTDGGTVREVRSATVV